jgi:hypothetical protein
MDEAYNITTDTFQIFPDFQASPSITIDNATALVGGASTTGDNGSAIVQIDKNDNQPVDITFSVSGALGGYAGYVIVLDNDSNLESYQLDPSSLDYSSSSLTYSFDDANATNGQTLSFMVFSKTNAGKYPYTENSFTVVLKTEAGLISDNSTKYAVSVSNLAMDGVDNSTRTYIDDGSYVIDSNGDGTVDPVTIDFTATSTLTPVDSFALSCDNSTGVFGKAEEYTYSADEWRVSGTNYSGNYTISSIILSDLFNGNVCSTEGNQTIYVAAITTGKTKSAVVSDTFEVDLTAPFIDSFTLHAADNSSKTDNVTDTTIGYTILFNDNNTADDDNGSYVTHYQVTTGTTAPAWNDTNWEAVTNLDNVTDNYTFSTLANTFTLNAWVKDNASLVSAYKADSINTLSDDSPPQISSVRIFDTTSGASDLTNDSDNVTVEIVAADTESQILSYYISEDNLTVAQLEDATFLPFASPGNSISENVTTNALGDNDTNGYVNLLVWVKNTQDNISVLGTDSDNITLDNVKPVIYSTPKLTGSVATTSSADNTSYTTTQTVTLDNFTTSNWANDNGTNALDNGSGVTYYHLTKSSSTVAPDADNSSLWQAWDNLTLTLDNTSNGWNSVSTLTDNNSVGNKTIYLWIKDAAHNVSAESRALSIYFDNESPSWSSSTFYLRDNNTDNDTFDLVYFDNASDIRIIADNVTGSDDGSGITGYYFTDNATRGAALKDNTTLSDNSLVWSSTMPDNVTLDNTSEGVHSIYGYIKDAAGNISGSTVGSITLDYTAPVIDNLTLASGFSFSGDYLGLGALTGNPALPTAASVELYLSATDNSSGFSSGWKDFCVAWSLARLDNETKGSSGSDLASCTWTSVVDNSSFVADTFDNVSLTLTLSTTDYFDNRTSSNKDNLTVTVWLRDNASNVDNFTSVFTLDNNTSNIWYTP